MATEARIRFGEEDQNVDLKGDEVWEALTRECENCGGHGFHFDSEQEEHERRSLSSYADDGRVVRARPRNRTHWRTCVVCGGRGRKLTPMGRDLALLLNTEGPGPEVKPL